MADSIRVFDPGFRVTDTSGNPAPGAKIKFYNAGGLVARTVYSDAGLSVSLGTTVTCNAAGAPAASGGEGGEVLIYTGTTAYKVVIEDRDGNVLHEFDNISGAIDTSTFAQDTALPRTPVTIKSTAYAVVSDDRGKVFNVDCTGGNVLITLPSAIAVGDNWRVTIRHIGTSNTVAIETVAPQTINGANSLILSYQYESVTLVSDGANWHVAEDALFRRPAGVVLPQGRLTLTSGTPVISSNTVGATSIYYTPYVGNLVPMWSGTRFVPYEFSELVLTLVSQHEASGLYDVFVFLDGSTLQIGTGPKWATVTPGSGARGSGPGSTELERISGVLVNAVDIEIRNGTSTYDVDENRATYLGTIYMDFASAGQVTCNVGYGQSRKWSVWNHYNRALIRMKAGDSTSTWSYASTTVRPSNNAAANSIRIVMGVADQFVRAAVTQDMGTPQSSPSTITSRVGIGWNSTTAFSGRAGTYSLGLSNAGTLTPTFTVRGEYIAPPSEGAHTITSLESSTSSGQTFNGGEDRFVLECEFWG